MATPIGHGIAGFGVLLLLKGERRRIFPAACLMSCLAAVAPDLDFLPGLLRGAPTLYHQGFSHSVVFALVASVLLAALARIRGWSVQRVFSLVFLSYSSHLLLDLGGPDGRLPYGIPLLWPFSTETFLSPVTILFGVSHAQNSDASTLEWFQGIFEWYNLFAVGLEIALVGGVVLLVWRIRQSRWRVGDQS